MNFLRKRIRKVSKRQAERLEEYWELLDQFLANHPLCEVSGCFKPSMDVHHKQGRTGALLTDTSKWLAVCRKCHIKITEESAWAIEQGYSIPRNR